MNRHLNIFHTYSKVNREQQLENDLTRALAICLQEDSLFLNSILKTILTEKDYESLFTDIAGETKVSIEIQKNVESLEAFNKLYALSITGLEMSAESFFNQKNWTEDKDYITDLVIFANDITLIAEVKPNNVSCTWQLAQQVHKSIKDTEIKFNDVIPVDLNWKKLMVLAVQVSNFNRASGNNIRFLNDFIHFIREHNHNWLPVAPFSSLANSLTKKQAYIQRLNTALSSISEEHPSLDYSDRMGLKLNLSWAQEIVFNIGSYKNNQAAVYFGFWPGNTKSQGSRMLNKIGKENWTPPSTIILQGNPFEVKWGFEIKFCHFNAYVSNLVIDDNAVKPEKQILSWNTHNQFTGKYDRKEWDQLEKFLDEYLVEDYDWRKELGWETFFVNSGRNYLTVSIGYQIETIVPISYLQQIDTSQNDLTKLSELIIEMKNKYVKIFDE